MANEDARGKQEGGKQDGSKQEGSAPARHWGGPRSVGSLLPAITRPAFRSRSALGAQLMADWPAIVGPALSRISAPRHLNRTTLTLSCSGPVALELQHLAGQLAGRINAHYGRTVVEQLRFVQVTAPPSGRTAAPRRAAPQPVEIANMKNGALRDALAALGGAVAQATSQAGSQGGKEVGRSPAKERVGRRLTRAQGSEA